MVTIKLSPHHNDNTSFERHGTLSDLVAPGQFGGKQWLTRELDL